MRAFQENIEKLKQEKYRLAITDRRMSFSRLVTALVVIFLGYQYYSSGNFHLLIAAVITIITFFLLVRTHKAVKWKHELAKIKIQINQDELSFLQTDKLNFEDGVAFIEHDHPYSYDLDFFGPHSLFQHLNRTGTVHGKRSLAHALLNIQSEKEIIHTQEAIKELAPNIQWRQHLLALARLKPDSEESHNELMTWARKKPAKFNRIILGLSFVLPLVTITLLCFYLLYSNELAGKLGGILFLTNLAILGSYTLKIKEELLSTTKIEDILKQYSFLLKVIENSSFQSEKLKQLQAKLTSNHTRASQAIHQLSLLFGRLEHVSNIFASPLLNGLLQYHLHVLRGLSNWRKIHASHLEEWLQVIGEIESLSSLANFSYNNPKAVFPTINQENHIHFEDLGHPLIARDKSVTNSINFDDQSFFILTGSNMSGKSTFLRTLGVNMVLAGIGAPVIASKANVHPLPVFVSMRLSDSLTDSESYFYSEVKRLKSIMNRLDQGQCFVLLDEILRGTNSDDKRTGTVEVIRRMVEKKALGGIATHDLEVCKVTEEYPSQLSSKRFEVEIVNDELIFDYKLRDGVCQNKSASFIMQKMGVI